MNLLQVSTLIPVIFVMTWALWVKCRKKKYKETVLLALTGICTLVNEYLVYMMMVGEISTALHIVQMGTCAAIVPLIYMFFSAQVNNIKSPTILALWVLALHSFVPNVIISNPFVPFEYPDSPLYPFGFYVISHGEKVFSIFMGDLMVMLQTVICIFKFIPFAWKLRKIDLHLSRKAYIFVAWCTLSAIAVVYLSGMSYAQLRSTAGELIYFMTYTLMTVSFNVFVILGFEVALVEDKEREVVNDLHDYVNNKRYEEMANAMRQIVEGEQKFLDPTCTAEYMVERLVTNRTYFSQMLALQIGMSYNEYINSLRMEYIENLLRNTDLSITDIAVKGGFNDSGYMSRKFREKYGVSPSVWRNSLK